MDPPLIQVTGADPMINAINAQGGVYMFGRMLPIWAVILMCPAMSLLAACFYDPYYEGFNLDTLLANWLKLVCFDLPFAFFTQLFFIQPLIRTVFKAIFCLKNRSSPLRFVQNSF